MVSQELQFLMYYIGSQVQESSCGEKRRYYRGKVDVN